MHREIPYPSDSICPEETKKSFTRLHVQRTRDRLRFFILGQSEEINIRTPDGHPPEEEARLAKNEDVIALADALAHKDEELFFRYLEFERGLTEEERSLIGDIAEIRQIERKGMLKEWLETIEREQDHQAVQ